MATLSLKISLDSGKVVKTMQFNPSTTVYDACHIIREKILEANMGEAKDYGLFLTSDEDTKKGIWLEPARSLDHYILRNGDVLEFNRKMRNLRVRMLDGSVKTLLVDDSQVVANLMVVICTKIGITNYDEYSLVREDPKDEQDSMEGKPNYGTLTLRRKNQEKERDVKMDQLRKKLRTDDEVNWVDPALTLREQGVEASETLLLRRKFFFSDRNVDSRDPVQLGLLYVQARDAIVDGTHPVTQDMACEFAGIQCQIQFGDHKDDKHILGFLDTKEFLPASYAKVKGIEKKMFKEHKRHLGLSELDAKVLYTKNARSLPTYGVAFFLVKEKMKGKNKLVPRLLGVSKDSVLRLDEKTKDILQTWPLTTVRRWCGSPNTFTLDFGDYSDQYYSVQTTEAEQILQVIAGYIDIILKKQKAKDHLGIEGDEGSTMVEDSVSPSKAQILQHERTPVNKATPESLALPAVVHPGGEGSKMFEVKHTSGALQTTESGQIRIGHPPPATNQGTQVRTTSVLSEPQRALLSTISSGREIIRETESHLTRATLPVELGHDAASIRWKEVQLDTNKQVVTSQIAAMNAATAQVVTLTSGPTEEVDHTAVGAAITTITSNLPEMTKGVQMIAALMEDEDGGDRLLDATRRLCTAFSDLLKAAEPEAKETRQNLLNAASRVGEASTNVLYTIGEETEENKEIQVTPSTASSADGNAKRRPMKKSFLYRKISYCYDNFYKVFFGVREKSEYGSDFGDMSDDEDYVKTIKEHDDDNVYEDIDVSNANWYFGKPLDCIKEESESEYYQSFDFKNGGLRNGKGITIDELNQEKSAKDNTVQEKDTKDGSPNLESLLENCEDYLEHGGVGKKIDEVPKPPRSTLDKIYEFKKDFSAIDPNAHHYVNMDFHNLDWKAKNNLAREEFFKSTSSLDKNALNEEFNKRKDRYDASGKNIECCSIRNDVTKSGPDVKVTGALNMKLINLDKYNRVLTTTETFTENAVASFTKSDLTKRKDETFENFVRRSEKFYTTESRDRTTSVTLNNEVDAESKPKTQIRIFYNPTFRSTGQTYVRGFCRFCRRRCPRTEEKCCQRCVCLELELKMIWKKHWLNILCFLALLFMFLGFLVRCFIPGDDCETDSLDGKCFEFV